jgi:hypothetical protein
MPLEVRLVENERVKGHVEDEQADEANADYISDVLLAEPPAARMQV